MHCKGNTYNAHEFNAKVDYTRVIELKREESNHNKSRYDSEACNGKNSQDSAPKLAVKQSVITE